MRELLAVLEAGEQVIRTGGEAVLATVVRVEGSTYRRPGARMLITARGDWVGGVSGGCLEGDLARKAWWRTESGPALVTYDSTGDDEAAWRFGLGCNGVAHVLLERFPRSDCSDPLAFVRRCVRRGVAGVLATVFRADPATGVAAGDRLTLSAGGQCDGDLGSRGLTDAMRRDAVDCLARDQSDVVTYSLPGGEADVLLEVVRPPVRLLIFGAGFDAVSVVHAAKALGWHVTVVDRRPGFARQAAFAAADAVFATPPATACARVRLDGRTAAVVMGHNFPDDRAAVEALLPSAVRYIGVLGPRARTQTLLAEIAERGRAPSREQLARVFAPVGLDIGAETPDEIAAAVVAEIVAVFAGHPGGPLRDRDGPIHRRIGAPRPAEAAA